MKQILLVLLVFNIITTTAQTRNDSIRRKAGKYITNKFPGTRFLDIQYEQFSQVNYTSTLLGEEMEKGKLQSQKRLKAVMNLPIYMKEKIVVAATLRYKYEELGFKNVETSPLTVPALIHGKYVDSHFFSGTLSFVYRSKLWEKDVIYNGNLIVDASQKSFERLNGTALAVLMLKKDKVTNITVGAIINTTKTAIFPILPTFTLDHKMKDDWTLDLVFPKYGYIRKQMFENGRLSMGIRYEDALFFSYPDQIGFTDKTYTYNRNEIRTELMYEHHLSNTIIVTLRGGGVNTFWAKMKVKNSGNDLIKVSQPMNAYLNIGFSYTPIFK